MFSKNKLVHIQIAEEHWYINMDNVNSISVNKNQVHIYYNNAMKTAFTCESNEMACRFVKENFL